MKLEKNSRVYSCSKEDFLAIVISSNDTEKSKIVKLFETEINDFVSHIFTAYELHESLSKKWKVKFENDEIRFLWIEKYIYYAIHNLLCSTSLLLAGYLVASGNLVRQFFESFVMAMAFANRKIDYFEKFTRIWQVIENLLSKYRKYRNENNKSKADEMEIKIEELLKKIDVNKAITEVYNNLEKFNIDEDSWKHRMRLRKKYHKFSHPAVNALYSISDPSKGVGTIRFGPRYDQEMIDVYRFEMNGRICFAKTLKNIIEEISSQLS